MQAPASRNTQETCTTYNVLKLAQSLLRWTGDGSYADFYERALLNGILGTQRAQRNVHSQAALPHLTLKPDLGLAEFIVPKHDVRLGLRHRRASPPRAIEGVGCCALLPTKCRQDVCLMGPSDDLASTDQTCGSQVKGFASKMTLMLRVQVAHCSPTARELPSASPASMVQLTGLPFAGVYLYLLPLGSGNAKSDSGHGCVPEHVQHTNLCSARRTESRDRHSHLRVGGDIASHRSGAAMERRLSRLQNWLIPSSLEGKGAADVLLQMFTWNVACTASGNES